MNGAQFARPDGLVYSTFASWVKKRKESREEPVAKSSPLGSLVEIDLAGASRRELSIELPQGARIHLTESGQVPTAAALIKALAQ